MAGQRCDLAGLCGEQSAPPVEAAAAVDARQPALVAAGEDLPPSIRPTLAADSTLNGRSFQPQSLRIHLFLVSEKVVKKAAI